MNQKCCFAILACRTDFIDNQGEEAIRVIVGENLVRGADILFVEFFESIQRFEVLITFIVFVPHLVDASYKKFRHVDEA